MSERRYGSDSFLSEPSHLTTLTELLRFRALHQPNRTAYTFLADGETEGGSLTYGELDGQARAVGGALREMGARGERALLLFPPGLEFIAAFWGCLYASAVAVPTNLPRLGKSAPRLEAILKDARPSLALTDARTLGRLERLFTRLPALRDLRWLAVDELTRGAAVAGQEPLGANGDGLAFLQYTSGSTGNPKGVMLTHQNLLSNASMLYRALEHTAEETTVSWLPTFHDMGFMAGILEPLYGGFPSVLMAPASFLQRPFRWLQAVSRYRATASGGPNFAYELCADKVTAEERASLDLSSWSAACNGAEPVRAATLEKFARVFEPCGFRREAFYPCYGLAEATLIVSGGRKAAAPVLLDVPKQKAPESEQRPSDGVCEKEGARLVGCGAPLGGQRVLIVRPESREACPEGETGEIWIAGPNVAQGYWNSPDETERTFRARLSDTGEGPFLRSGDLGFVTASELFVTGRLKDLIIVRGSNHYPQDIEHTVEQCHPGLRGGGGAAFSIEADGEERLVVVQELRPHTREETGGLIKEIRRSVAEEHEVHAYAVVLVRPGGVPRTSSGKVRRRACRDAYLSGRLNVLAEDVSVPRREGESEPPLPRPTGTEEVEAWLAARLAARLRVDASEIDLDRPLTRYGLDSLTAVEFAHGLEAALGTDVSSIGLLEGLSIRQFVAQALNDAEAAPARPKAEALSARRAEESAPLSWGQRALWFMHRLSPESAAYNISAAARIKNSPDVCALRRAFQKLVGRHPSLRTTFQQEGDVLQRVHERAELFFQEEDASGWAEARLKERLGEEAHAALDLEKGPLLRVHLFRRSAEEYVLLLVAHHIILDFWSLTLLARELGRLYEAEAGGAEAALPRADFSYVDYVRWQAELLSGPEGERQWSYWQKQLEGAPPVLNLPLDRPRPALQTYRGASVLFGLGRELTEKLKRLSEEQDVTLYVTLLSAFAVLLSRHTGQTDIVVGSPAPGRTRSEFAGVAGYCVAPLPLRADLSGDPRFDDLLKQVRRTVLHALRNQDYPFALLVERLQKERQPGRSPLFQVMFLLQRAQSPGEEELAAFSLGDEGARVELGGLNLEAVEVPKLTAQFELTLALAETGRGLTARLEYNADLFDPATAECFAGHYAALLNSIVTQPARPVSQLPMTTGAELEKVLRLWNGPPRDAGGPACLVEMLEAQAARTPERVALKCAGEQLTYAELNARANRLARHLRSKGVRPETPVAVCMGRSPLMVVGLLGILKAGGAYVPLDPSYPAARLSFMLADARVSLLLTEERLLDSVPSGAVEVLCLDREWPSIALGGDENVAHGLAPGNLAYVIYTSGSTGKPKGVAIEHRSAVALLEWAGEHFTPQDLSGVLASTSICFDLSVFELFLPLVRGGTVILAENALQLPQMEEADEVTLINTVPSAMGELVRSGAVPRSVLTVNLAGEVLHERLVQQVYQAGDVRRVFNLYGPSEDTTYSTFSLISKEEQGPPTIGRPVTGTQAYIVGQDLTPSPVRVAGELCLGGSGLARGYINNPALTAERFIPDPFGVVPGARLYRTGDLARFRADGEIEFLGRADQQMKLRGYRIELGEIESALREHACVKEAVVVAGEDVSGQARLVAYVVAEGALALSGRELREFVGRKLPGYMVPSIFVTLDALPLTPNGKVDRHALPPPDRTRPQPEETYVAPRTWVEETLADVWRDLLGVERVGVHEDFFALGGHSLLGTQLTTRVRAAFGVEISVRDVFASPTVAGLSLVIAQKHAGQSSADEIARLLEELEGLSDTEAQTILGGNQEAPSS